MKEQEITLFYLRKLQFFIDTLTILLYNIIIKKEKGKNKNERIYS